MKTMALALAGAALISFGAHTTALAGGGSTGGPPIDDPGGDPPPVDDTPPGDGGTGGGGGGGTPGTSALGTAPPAGTFDLETVVPHPPTTNFDVYSASSLNPTQVVNGVTLTLSTSGDTFYGLADESVFRYLGLEDATVGHASVFEYGPGESVGEIFANFSTQLSAFSLLAYKIAADYRPIVSLVAYSGLNGTGTVLGSTSGVFGGNGWQSATFGLTGIDGARSIGFHANTRGNVWFDNFEIAGVPEPTQWSLMILGFASVGALLRRRRTAIAA